MPRPFQLALLIALAAPAAGTAQTSEQRHATAVAEPRAVLICRPDRFCGQEPEAPRFVLYGDGLVIFQTRTQTALQSWLLSARLSESESSALLARIAPRSLLALANSYEGDVHLHAVWTELHVWVDGRHKAISVVGTTDRAPSELRRAIEAINGFSAPGTPWLPESVEAVLSPYEYRAFRTVPWPEGWPRVDGERAQKGMLRIALPKAEFGRLLELVRSVGPGHAIWAAYQPWHVGYRLPFPRESAWMR